MSRSYSVLAAALVGVVVLAAGARLLADDTSQSATAPVAVAGPNGMVDDEASSGELADPVSVIDPTCALSIRLELDDTHPDVACLESQLIDAGALSEVAPDEVFDEATDAAVRKFQDANGLPVDGVVGPLTARRLGSWVGPDVLPPDADTCPSIGRSVVVDRDHQRSWLCEAGKATQLLPITSAISQPDPGTYEVYAKDLNASSGLTGEYSEMTHFVAFSYGRIRGARIAFHSVPHYPNGDYVQPLDSVGTQELWGDSAGCIRVVPEHAELIWDWLELGDTVKVIT